MSKSTQNFADKLYNSIFLRKSFLVAGFDPVIPSFPAFIIDDAKRLAKDNEDFHFLAITKFYLATIEAVHNSICAIKPNLAFYEQYGIGGLRAYTEICRAARNLNLPIIADAKRGDIGSTAQAYSAAFLGENAPFQADALTVNPFLGFDTIEPFLADCTKFGRGLFILVKTSNPGSAALQNTTSEKVATWLMDNGQKFIGECGLSSLGAVVGATHPDEAKSLRRLMPNNFFLIPGYGAQGGSAADAIAGFTAKKHGGIINVSRGLTGNIPVEISSNAALQELLNNRIKKMNQEIATAIST